MALRYRRFREISRILPRIHSSDHLLQCGLVTKLSALSIIRQSHALERIDTEISQCGFRAKRSTLWAFLSGGSIHSAADRSHLIQYILKEYITFPIILSNKNFTEMENGACCILFKGFKSPVVYHEKDMDLRVLNKAVEDLLVQDDGSSRSRTNLKSTWTKQPEIIKESYGDSLRNLLFYLPGCISADECGNRLFLSDSNHHWIIVVDGNGFEDGNFECAKLARPAASFYDAAEDCLYFVDSENHAIRKADMESRVLETLYPVGDTAKKSNQLCTWITTKLVLRSNAHTRTEGFDLQSLMYPWHLMKSIDDSLDVMNRSFNTLWILNLASGEIKEVIRGFPKILEVCGQQVMEKVALLKQMPHDWLQQQTNVICSPEQLPYAGLLSSLTTLQNHVILCDMGRILKLSEESGVRSTFRLSKFWNSWTAVLVAFLIGESIYYW
ncbi:hypothetical protein ACFX10_035402 [Malus domestica]